MEDVDDETVIHNIVETSSEAGLKGVVEDDAEELLQSHGESLTKDELRELADRPIHKQFTASDAQEETPVRTFATELPSQNVTSISQITD